jgi:hypothetical protein
MNMFCPEVNIRALQKILSINISIYFSKLPIFAAFKSLMTNPGAVRPRFWKSPSPQQQHGLRHEAQKQ